MGRASKPWLRHKGKAPEKEYPKRARKKRSYKWALFWLILFGYYGAHRFYLWDAKKAGLNIVFYFFGFLAVLFLTALLLPELIKTTPETGVSIALLFASFIPWLLIILFEYPRLKRNVNQTNKEHLLN